MCKHTGVRFNSNAHSKQAVTLSNRLIAMLSVQVKCYFFLLMRRINQAQCTFVQKVTSHLPLINILSPFLIVSPYRNRYQPFGGLSNSLRNLRLHLFVLSSIFICISSSLLLSFAQTNSIVLLLVRYVDCMFVCP